jgi:hypothetical protein
MEVSNFAIGTMLAAICADTGLPKMVGLTADLANAMLPQVMGIPLNPTTPALAVYPVVMTVACFLAAGTAAADPFMSKHATPVHDFISASSRKQHSSPFL